MRRLLLALWLAGAMAASAAAAEEVIPMGRTVGIRMSSDCVLVTKLTSVETIEGSVSPAQAAGLQEGDLIREINGAPVSSNDALQQAVAQSGGQPLSVQCEKDGQKREVTVTPARGRDGVYRIGVIARDSIAGIGTVTYVDPETGDYGSLGHGICDADTGVLIPLGSGGLMESSVESVQRGEAGDPGALQGDFNPAHEVGTVRENTETGIFGQFTDPEYYNSLEKIPVAHDGEVTLGQAEILSNVSGQEVGRYSVEITKIFDDEDEYGRSMMVRVTDDRLLDATGGIVQGMSGSPLLQNGKLVGAVTHVLVNDPTRGYAVMIDAMLEEMEN
ncbi:MAG: SpoIVB peptidase [Clostridiaceae bacterium]|nr:SpoIVB peptidase [Clostridiaceae bacterium]